MKKTVSFLLAFILLLCMTLVACDNSTPADDPSKTPVDPNPSTDPGTPDGGEEPIGDERMELALPDVDFNGAPFHILQWSANGVDTTGTNWIPWEEGDLSDEAGDLMSNAVYARNAWVEEQFGVDITAEYVSVDQGYTQRMMQDAETGANEFQLATMRSHNAWALIEAGLFYDMSEFEGDILHTDQPWWPSDAVASFRLGNSLYVCATEMLLRDKGSTAALYFNPTIAHNYGVDYMYDLVDSGDWTLENMVAAGMVVANSADGNDLMDTADDMWGLVSPEDTSAYLFAGAGMKYGHIDENGYVVYDFGNAETINAMQTIFEDVMYADWAIIPTVRPLDGTTIEDVFKSDNALFYDSLVKYAYIYLRDMETPYGILPQPKLNEEQDDYASLVWIHHDSTVGIPSNTFDPEMSAMILEALSYEGYYSVTPELYETLLLNRLAKSPEAKASLETIFATRVYDPGQYWDLAGGMHFITLRHDRTGNSNFASLWETHESATMEQIGKVNAFIEENK